MTAPQQLYAPQHFLLCKRKECGAIVSKKHAPEVDGRRTCPLCGHRMLAEIEAKEHPVAGSD